MSLQPPFAAAVVAISAMAPAAAVGAEMARAANTLELRAVGMRFEGPHEIPSGWVTIRLENLSA